MCSEKLEDSKTYNRKKMEKNDGQDEDSDLGTRKSGEHAGNRRVGSESQSLRLHLKTLMEAILRWEIQGRQINPRVGLQSGYLIEWIK